MLQLYQYRAFEKAYVLEVKWHSPEFVTPYDRKFPPERNYTVFHLTGNRKDDNTKLDFAELVIREMLVKFDTTNAVRIHFSDTARYGSFIQALDICNKMYGLSFVPYENDLWIFNQTRNFEESTRIGFCGTSHVLRSMAEDEHSTLAFPFDYEYRRKFWPMAIALIILAALSLKKRIY